MAQDKKEKPIDQIRANVSRMLETLDPKAPISATVVFQVKKDDEAAFNKNADVLAEDTRKLAGCNVFVFEMHQPYVDEPGGKPDAVEYMIYEDWETVEQFRKQWDSEHLKQFQDSVFALLADAPDLTFYKGWKKTGHGLSQTGQKQCWNSSGMLIDCAGTGHDGDIRAGLPWPDSRFTDHSDGTVTDNLTGLIWLKNANLFGEVTLEQALENVRQLKTGSCGLADGSKAGDWRLPNVNELESLLDLNTTSGPAVASGHPFTNLETANYWSGTAVAAFPALGWYVAMAVGCPVFDLKFNFMRMWPVRGTSTLIARTGQKHCYGVALDPKFGLVIDCKGTGQDGEKQSGLAWPDPRFQDNNNGTVTDNLTGLVWLKNGSAFGTRTWDDALKCCKSLAGGNYGLTDGSKAGDWRLPNINELRSLEDYGQHTPAITAGHPFTNVGSSLCWSSTTVASAPSLARFLFVGIGSCVWDHKSVLMGVWPVRSLK